MRRTKFANWLITFFVAIVLVLLGGFFAFTSKGVSLLGITEEQLAAYVQLSGITDTVLDSIKTFWNTLIGFSNWNNIYFLLSWLVIVLVVIVVVIQIIAYSRNKNTTKMLWWIIFTIILGAISAFLCGFITNIFTKVGGGRNATKIFINWLLFKHNIWVSLFIYIFLLGVVLFYVSALVLLIKTLVYSSRFVKYAKSVEEERAAAEEGTLSYDPEAPTISVPGNTNNINTVGNASPLIVQYINSYGSPAAPVAPATQPVPAPKCECKEEVKEEKREECKCPHGGQYPYPPYPYAPYPYPYGYYPPYAQAPIAPTQEKEEGEKPLTKSELKQILEEMKEKEDHCACGCECEKEIELSYRNEEGEELEYLDMDDLKTLVHNEVDEYLSNEYVVATPSEIQEHVEEVKEEVKDPEPKVEETVAYEEKETTPVVALPATSVVSAPSSKVEVTTPIVVAVPSDIVPVEVEEEKEVEVEEPVEETETLSEDDVRELIASELAEALKDISKPKTTKVIHKVTKEVPVEVVKEVPVVKEVTVEKIVEKPVEKPVIIEQKPAKPQPIIKNSVKRGQENVVEKENVVKYNFLERIATGDDLLKANYNAIKGLLLSYGLKNRLSNNGDTFRAHKVTYAKITCNGESLKLYLALDPKEFYSTALPVQDVSSKDAYKDIPLAFKVRSELSLRRANELIAACMRKAQLEINPEFKAGDYAKEISTELDNIRKVEAEAAKKKSKK